MSERRRSRVLGPAGAVALATLLIVPGCDREPAPTNDRWVTTENTTVDIDWDAVAKAYKEAEGPEDFEQRVNEIYTGSEVISVAVADLDEKTQEVTGFVDRNTDGKVEDPEKVFTIKRDVTGPESAQYQISGHGAYASYRSPMWDIAAGMMLGSMMSRVFTPGYRPVYTQAYVTPPARRDALVSHRDTYRKQNPDKFRTGQSSKSGRSYGSKGSNFGGGRPSSSSTPAPRPSSRPRSFGGGRFGRSGRAQGRGPRRVVRLVS